MNEKATATAPTQPATPIRMTLDKPCKGSVRYKSDDPKSPIKTVYVERAPWNDEMPVAVMVKVEPA